MLLVNTGLNRCVIKLFLKNGVTLNSFPDCYKIQQLCDKAVDTRPYTI